MVHGQKTIRLTFLHETAEGSADLGRGAACAGRGGAGLTEAEATHLAGGNLSTGAADAQGAAAAAGFWFAVGVTGALATAREAAAVKAAEGRRILRPARRCLDVPPNTGAAVSVSGSGRLSGMP